MDGDVVTIAQTELQPHSLSLLGHARTLAVTDQSSFSRAAELVRAVKVYLARVAEVFDPVIRAAHLSHKTAVEQKHRLEQPALQAEMILKAAIAAYEQAQTSLRREAEERARRERERLEDVARARAEAERARLEAEAEERLVGAGLEAEARGDMAGAARLLTAPPPPILVVPDPVFVPVPVVEVPTAEGVSFRTTYRAEVVDLMALVLAVANRQQPLSLLSANDKALNGMARAQGDAMAVPGVRVVRERVAAVRT